MKTLVHVQRSGVHLHLCNYKLTLRRHLLAHLMKGAMCVPHYCHGVLYYLLLRCTFVYIPFLYLQPCPTSKMENQIALASESSTRRGDKPLIIHE